MTEATAALAWQLDLCRQARNPFDRFNSVILQRPPLWSAQRRIARALVDPTVRRILVKSGHMTGKDYSAGGFALAWLTMHAYSGVVIVGPKLDQVRRSTWKEVKAARASSPLLRNVGNLRRTPMSLEYDDGWMAFVTAFDQPEGLQGFHPKGPVLVIVGEASGINDPDVNQSLQSLKPVKRLDIFNPLKDYGEVYEACQRAADDPTIRVISIPSTDSPDIHLETSPRGLADAAWLRGMIADYGLDSQTYRVRVGAEFPDGGFDLLIPNRWLDRSAGTNHTPGGNLRMAVDLGLGTGGDDTVILVRDDNGVVWFHASKFQSLEESARTLKRVADHYEIPPGRITWDAAGIGADFDRRLRDVGLLGCMPYVGSRKSKNHRFNNLRTASHFAMRRRLDPDRRDENGAVRPQFHLPPDFLGRFRRESRELTFETLDSGRMSLRDGDEVKAALRHSPDYSVTLAQSFAYPYL